MGVALALRRNTPEPLDKQHMTGCILSLTLQWAGKSGGKLLVGLRVHVRVLRVVLKKNGSREGYVTLTYAYVYSCTRPVRVRVQLLPSYLRKYLRSKVLFVRKYFRTFVLCTKVQRCTFVRKYR